MAAKKRVTPAARMSATAGTRVGGARLADPYERETFTPKIARRAAGHVPTPRAPGVPGQGNRVGIEPPGLLRGRQPVRGAPVVGAPVPGRVRVPKSGVGTPLPPPVSTPVRPRAAGYRPRRKKI